MRDQAAPEPLALLNDVLGREGFEAFYGDDWHCYVRHLKVELVEPDGMPAMRRIVWPPQPTVVDPKRFPDVAATVAQLVARAHIVLAGLKAHGK